MGLWGIIPLDLMSPDRKDDVIIILAELPIAPRRKKQALAEWAQCVGLGMTKDDYQKLLGIGQPGV